MPVNVILQKSNTQHSENPKKTTFNTHQFDKTPTWSDKTSTGSDKTPSRFDEKRKTNMLERRSTLGDWVLSMNSVKTNARNHGNSHDKLDKPNLENNRSDQNINYITSKKQTRCKTPINAWQSNDTVSEIGITHSDNFKPVSISKMSAKDSKTLFSMNNNAKVFTPATRKISPPPGFEDNSDKASSLDLSQTFGSVFKNTYTIKQASLEAFDVSVIDLNDKKATDNVHDFLVAVMTIEHYCFHSDKNTDTNIYKIVNTVASKLAVPGQKLFNQRHCTYCASNIDPQIMDVYHQCKNNYLSLATALSNTPTQRVNVLFDSSVLGRSEVLFLPMYLICYRLDILLTIPFVENAKCEKIAHSIISNILSKFGGTYKVGSILGRETAIVEKYGYNDTYLALMCAKMFGVVPTMSSTDMIKFNVKCRESIYSIIPSLSFNSLIDLTNKFDVIALDSDGAEFLPVHVPLNLYCTYWSTLIDSVVRKNPQLLNDCSREFAYYLGTNPDDFNNYKTNPSSNASLLEFQSYFIEKVDKMSGPAIQTTKYSPNSEYKYDRFGIKTTDYYGAEIKKRVGTDIMKIAINHDPTGFVASDDDKSDSGSDTTTMTSESFGQLQEYQPPSNSPMCYAPQFYQGMQQFYGHHTCFCPQQPMAIVQGPTYIAMHPMQYMGYHYNTASMVSVPMKQTPQTPRYKQNNSGYIERPIKNSDVVRTYSMFDGLSLLKKQNAQRESNRTSQFGLESLGAKVLKLQKPILPIRNTKEMADEIDANLKRTTAVLNKLYLL